MKGTTKNYFLAIIALLSIFLSGCKKDDTIYYVHSDHIKTPEVVTDKDKKIVWEGHRKPFGETEVTVSTITQPIRFPGQYYDQETGLSYNLMRDYDPKTGRYLEADPLGLASSMSIYGYAGQNPVMAYDPDGQFFFLLFAPALGLTTGTALAFDFLSLSLLASGYNANIILMNSMDDSSSGANTWKACPPKENNEDPCKGLREQLNEHKRKLEEYIANPLASDNKGFLQAALDKGNLDLYDKIVASRIASLQWQIANFEMQLKQCESLYGPKS